MSEGSKTIIERSWRWLREISEADLRYDLDRAREMSLPVHRWSGEDRDGRPFTVVWVAGPGTGAVFSAYEISGVTT
jgi:hypothetical protein